MASDVDFICSVLSDTLTEFGLAASYRSWLFGRRLLPVGFIEPVLIAGPWVKIEVDVSNLPRGVFADDLQDERLLFVLRQRLVRNVEVRCERTAVFLGEEKLSVGRGLSFYFFVEADAGRVRGVSRVVEWTAKVLPSSGTPLIDFGVALSGPIYRPIYDLVGVLVGGASRQGKSVFLNSVICQLLVNYVPDRVCLSLVDFKGGVEFSPYDGLLGVRVVSTFDGFRDELAFLDGVACERYALFSGRARDIVEFNLLVPECERLPYHIVIIDEFANLVAHEGQRSRMVSTVIDFCARLAAAGIHFIISTQRPTVDVVSGNLKANLTTRLSFRMASSMDSRVVLDRDGAESLGCKGRFLLLDGADCIEVQSACIDLAGVRAVVAARPHKSE